MNERRKFINRLIKVTTMAGKESIERRLIIPKRYIRFKNIPEDGLSSIHDGDLGVVGKEDGVSCYDAFFNENQYQIVLPSLCVGACMDMSGYVNRFLGGEIPCYLVEGDEVGRGTYGEPTLKNVKIIKELALKKPAKKLDKTNIQFTVEEVK